MRRTIAAVVAVPALLLATLAASPALALDEGASTSPSQMLAELTVAPPSTVPYNRDLFAEGIDVDGDGCNTRREVLQLESLTPVTIPSGCDITAGQWFSWYEGVTQADPSALEMDHVVALKEAWISGAHGWNDQQRSDYANDLDIDATLTVVTGSVNGAKSAYDPSGWVPSYEPSRCRFASDWITVKYRWNLTVDEAEKAALQSLIDTNCGDTQIVVPPVRTDIEATPQPAPGGGVNPMPPGTHRLSGGDRFATAVAISSRFNPGVPAVYVATGLDYPDALAASAVAGAEGVPLLLVRTHEIPAVVWTELERLAPQKIMVAGGASVVSEAVVSNLATLAPVNRYAGADRYETSRMLAEQANLSGSTTFIATGANFPDALSSAAAAGSQAGSVVLTNGAASAADSATKLTLSNIGTSAVRIAGGTSVVSSGIQSSLQSSYQVVRYAGQDRYHTGALVNQGTFSNPSTVFLAFGMNFPDALVGGALAAATDSPLFIVRGNCIPSSVHDVISAWSPSSVVLLGGEGVLTNAVASLTECVTPPPPLPPAPPTPPTPPAPPSNPGDTKNCSHFGTWGAAQAWFNTYYRYYGDVAGLDGDNDLIACESLPGAP